jgi:hypothetical protein
LSGFSEWVNNNPTIALGGSIIVVLLGGAFLLNKKTTSAAATSSTTGIDPLTGLPTVSNDLSGLTTASNGQGLVYVPTSTQFTTYNATDASQNVTNSGSGNVTTGTSQAGNTSAATGTSQSGNTVAPIPLPQPVKVPPVTPPKQVSMQWTQHVTTANQTLNSIAGNATFSMTNDKLNTTKTRYVVTGQQIYNFNKAGVDAFFAKKYPKGTPAGSQISAPTTGLAVIIPQLRLG